ncbi:FAD-binding domain-containing protein [Caldiplasma sukawensis]
MKFLYIMMHDIRANNNPVFKFSNENGYKVAPVVLIDSKMENGGGALRTWMKKSLLLLRKDLKTDAIPFLQFNGETLHWIMRKVKENDFDGVLIQHIPYKKIEFMIQQLKMELSELGKKLIDFPPNNIMDMNEFENKKINFGSFNSFFQSIENKVFSEDFSGELPEIIPLDYLYNLDFSDWERKILKKWSEQSNKYEDLTNFIIKNSTGYRKNFDFSRLSPYIRGGNINIRKLWNDLVENDRKGSYEFRRQLAWRDFYYASYFRRPQSAVEPIDERFKNFKWETNSSYFDRWRAGETGFPIIDAAMHQLWEEGWMDNKKRMLVSDFLVKIYRINWKMGAEWFMDTLVDADDASNYGSWQWISGTGDFSWKFYRIFNPVKHSTDPSNLEYIKKWKASIEVDQKNIEFYTDRRGQSLRLYNGIQ